MQIMPWEDEYGFKDCSVVVILYTFVVVLNTEECLRMKSLDDLKKIKEHYLAMTVKEVRGDKVVGMHLECGWARDTPRSSYG